MTDTFRKQYRELSDDEKMQLERLKILAEGLMEQIGVVSAGAASGDSRCFALARTKLEESIMWAVKGATA